MEHKIGEIVTLPDGRKVRVVLDTVEPSYLSIFGGCWECVFGKGGDRKYCADIAGECSEISRTDHKEIIYKEVK